MRKCKLRKSRLEFTITSEKGTEAINVICGKKVLNDGADGEAFDVKPGCMKANNVRDLRESLCWCYNGWTDQFEVVWHGTDRKGTSYGTAYVFI